MNEHQSNILTVTCVNENEDGSADIEVEVGSAMSQTVSSEGIVFLLLKGILEGTTEDVLRWAQLGKEIDLLNK